MKNRMTISIVITIMLATGWVALVVDIKEVFLYGEFQDNEEIYMKVPQGWVCLITADASMGSINLRWRSGTSFSNA